MKGDRYIYVGIYHNGAYEPCGTISFNTDTKVAGFTYMSRYEGPPIDPINLNYRTAGTRAFAVSSRFNTQMLHRVFSDYMPGAWGLSVLEAEHPELKQMTAAEKLYWFGSRTVGALSFFVKHMDDEHPVRGIDYLESIREKAIDFYTKRILSMNLGRTVPGLASHGGARPKASFEDKTGGQWIVKFNVDHDAYNYAKIEHAAAKLARACGIESVETRVFELSQGNDALFVRRYDRLKDARPHRISMYSLMPENLVREPKDGDYKLMFEVLDRIACDPDKAKKELLRRMMFNIAVNNTDDHLKNFELLMDIDRGCFSMSPQFDVVQDLYEVPHTTPVFGVSKPNLSDFMMERIASESNMDIEQISQIRDEVVKGARQWREIYKAAGITAEDMRRLEKPFAIGMKQDTPKQMVDHKKGPAFVPPTPKPR